MRNAAAVTGGDTDPSMIYLDTNVVVALLTQEERSAANP
ncbi:MAG: hypothetical protein ACI9IO_000463 [Cyanobium sp.]